MDYPWELVIFGPILLGVFLWAGGAWLEKLGGGGQQDQRNKRK